jgi:outer membrane protein OmpA-like peptidoglycan-associated protein
MRSIRILLIFFFTFALIVANSNAQISAGKSSIGIFGGATKMIWGNRDDSMVSPWAGVTFTHSFRPNLGIELSAGMGWDRPRDTTQNFLDSYFSLRPGTPYRTFLYPFQANLKFNMNPESKVNSYFVLGLGALVWDLRDVSSENNFFPLPASGTSISGTQANIFGNLGFGIEFFNTENFSFDISFRYQQLVNQNKDMSGYGDANSGNFEGRFGLNYYFGGWKDTDGDGIEDKLDECPDQAEDIDGFQDNDGCPDLDNDNDGIPDATDQAPDLPEDLDGFEDSDGIPDLDNDQDGITDADDQCPNQAEDIDNFEDDDGCPDLDNDNDGIQDDKDQCPNEAEVVNGFEDEDGCPDEVPEPKVEIVKEKPTILKGVNFEFNSAQLTQNAMTILDLVYDTMEDFPDMVVEVSGHTDAVGSASYNYQLSLKRAQSVKNYLVSRGISSNRIVARGYGEERPIAPNNTEEGRAKNRRIEIVRLE